MEICSRCNVVCLFWCQIGKISSSGLEISTFCVSLDCCVGNCGMRESFKQPISFHFITMMWLLAFMLSSSSATAAPVVRISSEWPSESIAGLRCVNRFWSVRRSLDCISSLFKMVFFLALPLSSHHLMQRIWVATTGIKHSRYIRLVLHILWT